MTPSAWLNCGNAQLALAIAVVQRVRRSNYGGCS